jgi:hypothetical protein
LCRQHRFRPHAPQNDELKLAAPIAFVNCADTFAVTGTLARRWQELSRLQQAISRREPRRNLS